MNPSFHRAQIALSVRYFLLTAATIALLSVGILLLFRLHGLGEIDRQVLKQAEWIRNSPDASCDAEELAPELAEISLVAEEPVGVIAYDAAGDMAVRHGFLSNAHISARALESYPRNHLFRTELPGIGLVKGIIVAPLCERYSLVLVTAGTWELDASYRALSLDLLVTAFVALVMSGLLGWRFAYTALRPAQDAHRRMQQYLADSSHELRTPLTAIMGEADVTLRRPREPEEYRRTLELCRTYASQMIRLVEGIIELSRLDADMPSADVTVVDLADVAQREVDAVRRTAVGGPQILYDCGGETIVIGDMDQLGRLVRNLLDNAVRHTDASGTVTVSVTATDGGRSMALVVADTGEGIAPEHLPHVYDRFYRGGEGRDGDYSGSGLGLAIVKAIVSAHGGTVSIESQVGVGTTVTVILPSAS